MPPIRSTFPISRPFFPASPLHRLVEEVRYFSLSPTLRAEGPASALSELSVGKRVAEELGLPLGETFWRIKTACEVLPPQILELPPAEAAALADWPHICFPNLPSLSDEAARALAPDGPLQEQTHVNLPSLGALSPEALGRLASLSQRLTLGLPDFSVSHAMALQTPEHRRRPYEFNLQGLCPGGAAAEVLFWNRPVRLTLVKPPDIASVHSIVEAKFQASSFLSFKGGELPDPLALLKALVPFEGGLQVLGLSRLDTVVASRLAALQAAHLLVSGEHLSVEAARVLRFFQGKHLVLGSESVAPGVLQSLLDYEGPLLVWGAEELTESDVAAILRNTHPVSLPCVKELTDRQVFQLRERGVPVEFGPKTKLSRRMRTLLNDGGYGSISFGNDGPELVPLIPLPEHLHV
jgi:hypothetical protein